MRNSKYLFLSVLIHALILIPFGVNVADQNAKQETPPIHVKLLPKKKHESPSKEMPSDPDGFMGVAARPSCNGKQSYKGIGIMWLESTGFIMEAADGYPAKAAGVMSGDRVVNSAFTVDGEYLVFEVERYNVRVPFRIKMEMICVESRVIQKP